jgi:hypothetical protein
VFGSEDEGPGNEDEGRIGGTSLFASEDEGPDTEGEGLVGRTSFFASEDEGPEGDPDVQGLTADFDADRFDLGSDDAGIGSLDERFELSEDDPGGGWLD